MIMLKRLALAMAMSLCSEGAIAQDLAGARAPTGGGAETRTVVEGQAFAVKVCRAALAGRR